MRLQTKLILIICSFLSIVIISLGSIFYYIMTTALEDQIGTRALKVAETVANMPDIRHAFQTSDPSRTIQPIAETIREKIDAEYIVVGNREGIRFSHPLPERIGKEMVGGDNGPVLEGKSIISKAIGSLGPSLRGKAPIFDEQNQVIGIVSVGFLTQDIDSITYAYQSRIEVISLIVLIFGLIGSILIARNVRSSIHGLEPKEIGELYTEKQAILQTIREGIIAINRDGFITMVNRYALQLMQLPLSAKITGRHIEDVIPNTRLTEVVRTGEADFDHEMLIGDHDVIVNRVPIISRKNGVTGAVSSFRSKSELYRLAEELSQVKRFAEALRAQTHEFSNKLYVISGLIQLESYQEAVDLISKESDVHQNWVQFIMTEIPDPMIGGLLIGKFNHAQELKLTFDIDRESSFRDIPEEIDRNLLITIIGNLIDNAMEAVLAVEVQTMPYVKLFLTDLGEDLIIECEDCGIGIPDELGNAVFEKGFSTKAGENRGIGLALVQHAVRKLNGYITFHKNPECGTVFTVAIPKHPTSTERSPYRDPGIPTPDS
ncbi:sensor histidine kinase [Paenibacillus sp. CGMCC 1.16610]|uniref:histidine kinase n=1 Tax=Paenibacillus anseongense TaxID=2682845 RepID=A0ABW9UJB8_9BACL|nr:MULTISPECIES: sensor histidine kinase [Paenibacillus]MBA2939586.1 sensor histidine kinase [Paenibacillus sp. CGMCC 1.16610]MVQ39248.1 GHKL domain-containing protein [Paenibacillus anseongense]